MVKRRAERGNAAAETPAEPGRDVPEPAAPAAGFPPQHAQVLQPAIVAGLQQLGKQGQGDKVASLVRFYRNDAPSRVESMKRAVETGDAVELCRAAGTLKWTSMNIGATELAASCLFLEQIARDREIDPHTDRWLVLRIESLLLAVLAAIDTELVVEAA